MHVSKFLSLATLAILVILVWLTIPHAIVHVGLRLVVVALMVQPVAFLALLIVSLRLAYLADAGLWRAMRAVSLSLVMLYVLPSRLSEFVKPFYLSDESTAPSRALAAVFCERLSDLVVVAFAVAAAALFLAVDGFRVILPYWIAVAAAVLLFCVILIARPILLEKLVAVLPWKRFGGLAKLLLAEAQALITVPKLLISLGLGTLAWASSFLMTYVFLWGGATHVLQPAQAFVVFLAGALGYALTIMPGSLGTFEAAIVVALKLYGFDVSEALALALGLRLANLVLPAIISAFVFIAEPHRFHTSVRQFAEMWRSQTAQDNGGADG